MEMKFTSDITVRLIQEMGGDYIIVAAAKVSTTGQEAVKLGRCACPIHSKNMPEWNTCEDCKLYKEQEKANYGLIKYLMQHKHGTPFEHSTLTFFVHAPIFVWREWHRHRIGFCLAGDTLIDFVDTNGTRAPGICRTIKQLHDRWEHGEDNGHSTDQDRLSYGLSLIADGVSIRTASIKSGIARGTLVRHRTQKLSGTKRGSRWRIEGMRARVLDEETQFFTQGYIENVFESGVKELLSIETEKGHKVKASKDHRFLTEDGWVKAEDLRKGDRVAVVGKRSMFAERQIPPSLRSGIGVWTSMQRNRLIKERDQCFVCGNYFHRSCLVLDHVIPVVTDLRKALDILNLKPTCERCHRIKTNSEQKLAQRGCVAGSKFVRIIKQPSVCSEETTYDLSMSAPHHNFVANGMVVHNSYNEESARYKILDPVFYIPPRDRPMIKVEDWKPGRPKFQTLDEFRECVLEIAKDKTPDERAAMHPFAHGMPADRAYQIVIDTMKEGYINEYRRYELQLSRFLDPGLARDCLPVGIYSSCWVTCNPRSLMSFLSLRTHDESAKYISFPLYEIELAAKSVEEIFKQGWPLCWKAFQECGRVGP